MNMLYYRFKTPWWRASHAPESFGSLRSFGVLPNYARIKVAAPQQDAGSTPARSTRGSRSSLRSCCLPVNNGCSWRLRITDGPVPDSIGGFVAMLRRAGLVHAVNTNNTITANKQLAQVIPFIAPVTLMAPAAMAA